ncbi:MAG: HEPN domain-containing protein [Candidatus Rokubacteria bacterium]|nr:HEPN domain-containing protein [Candidatus Rokubacteria bacterium]
MAGLLTELAARHAVAEPLREAALELDKAYIPARSPNAHPSGSPRTHYTRADVARLISSAQEIVSSGATSSLSSR